MPGERRQIVQKEDEGEEVNLVASARHVKKGKNNISEQHATFLECPHACIAYSDVPATWGSRSEGNISDTDVPSTSDELEEDEPHTDDDFEYDEEFAVHGGTQGVEEVEAETIPDIDATVAEEPPVPPIPENTEVIENVAGEEPCDADEEELLPAPPKKKKKKKRGKRKKKEAVPATFLDYAAAAVQASEDGHVDLVNREALHLSLIHI